MATSCHPDHNEEYGNRYRRQWGLEGGDYRIQGQLTVDGLTFLNSNVRIGGDLIFSSTSRVDIETVIDYNFMDPLIDLNTSYVGPAPITAAGLTIYRGVALPRAVIHFMEGPLRTPLEWRIGLEGDILRVGRINDTMYSRGALYWDTVNEKLSSSSAFLINAADITSTIPFFFNLPVATVSSVIRYNESIDDMLVIECYDGAVFRDALSFGFTATTYDTHTFNYAATLSSNLVMRFAVATPEYARVKYIFDDDVLIGTDTDLAALIHTDKAILRVSGTSLNFSATPGSDELVITTGMIDVYADVDLHGYSLIVTSITTTNLTTTYSNYNIPVGFTPIPVVGGWGGSIIYNGMTYTESTNLSSALVQYEVQLDYTIIAPGEPTVQTTLVAPINIGGSLAKIRSIHGVVQYLVAGVPTVVYGLTPNDCWIQPVFDISLLNPLLTPLVLAPYAFLSVNIRKNPGIWRVIATIVTKT